MTYIDGFMAAVPTANKEAFLTHAEEVAVVFKEYGALSVVENWGNDIPEGEINSMRTAVLCEADETVVFSWVVWPSKDARDAGWEKMMEDPRMDPKDNPMPFDAERMIYGGFDTILEA